MLTEDELRSRMHGELGDLLDHVQPSNDLIPALRRRQQRWTRAVGVVAAAGVVVAASSPFIVRVLGNRTGSMSAVVTAGMLVSTGECAGLAVTFSLPGESPTPLFPLKPSPDVNTATMNNNDLRYLQASGPCRQRLRMHTVGVLLQGADPTRDQYFDGADGIAIVVSKGVLPGGTETVELFLDCTDCPRGGRPIAVLEIEVRPGIAQPTLMPSSLGPTATSPGRAESQDRYPVNARGQTYGSGSDAGPDLNGVPDLVSVIATNGKVGYALREDLDSGGAPRTVEEVRAMQKSGQRSRDIPVYQQDGTTVIGVFMFGGGEVVARGQRR
jgi:hypothetical protein